MVGLASDVLCLDIKKTFVKFEGGSLSPNWKTAFKLGSWCCLSILQEIRHMHSRGTAGLQLAKLYKARGSCTQAGRRV